jgi:hypothetical protein
MLKAAMICLKDRTSRNVFLSSLPKRRTTKRDGQRGALKGLDSIVAARDHPISFWHAPVSLRTFHGSRRFLRENHREGRACGLPHLAIDPITMAATAIGAVQTIISRELNPVESGVISICKMEAGRGAYNVIPESVSFGGTIRSLTPELRDYLPRRMKEVLEGIVSGMRGSYEFNLMPRFPLTINDIGMTSFADPSEMLRKEKYSDQTTC